MLNGNVHRNSIDVTFRLFKEWNVWSSIQLSLAPALDRVPQVCVSAASQLL